MSGDTTQNGEPSEPAVPVVGEPADSGVIPVEVQPPGPETDLEAKIANLEKDKKENWDRYLRAAANFGEATRNLPLPRSPGDEVAPAVAANHFDPRAEKMSVRQRAPRSNMVTVTRNIGRVGMDLVIEQ